MSKTREYDARISDWLEDGPQAPPEWMVEAAIREAHALPQLKPRLGLPWNGWPRRSVRPQALISLAAGGLGALVVVAAFSIGLLTGQDIGASPSPSVPPASAEPSVGGATTPPARSVAADRVPVGELGGEFYTLIGLAASSEAVWTTAVFDNQAGGVTSALLRIDIESGQPAVVPLPEAAGLLSPPAASGNIVWTASDAGLHTLEDSSEPAVTTFPTGFRAHELSIGPEGLWVAHEDGVSLHDPATGERVRQLSADVTSGHRTVGAPAFGSLWACMDDRSIGRIDSGSGEVVATIELPSEAAGVCRGGLGSFSGIAGVGDGIVASQVDVIIDPSTNQVSRTLHLPARWLDFVVVDSTLWFGLALGGDPAQLGLARLDPANGTAAEVLTVDAELHSNASFATPSLLVAGNYLWVLGQSSAPGAADVPHLLRLPLSELR